MSRFHTIFARVTKFSSFPKKPVPININNSLPSINLPLLNPNDDEHRMRILVDTGAVTNTGNFQYHP